MEELILKWRKKARTGSHRFTYKGKKYRVVPGDIVDCPKAALGAAICYYDCLTPEKEIIVQEEPFEVKNLVMIQNEDKTWNIINPDNPSKPLNQKGLRKSEATAILGKLYPGVEEKVEE